jgi:hypothetical protein
MVILELLPIAVMKLTGGVYDGVRDVPLVCIVPDRLPAVQVTVWMKLDNCSVIVIEKLDPTITDDTEVVKVLAAGLVTVKLTDFEPILVEPE